MKALFLVEAGGRYGLGHLARSVVLADALQMRRAETSLALRRDAGPLPNWLLSGKRVVEFASAGDVDKLVAEHDPAWVVVDGYGLLADGVVQRLRAAGRHVLAFDDLGDEGGGADLVVNQNWPVPDANVRSRLLGPTYAVVDAVYAANRERSAASTMQRVLITFGGSDLRELTVRAVQAFEDVPGTLSLDVVAGPYHRARTFVSPGQHRLFVHQAPQGLAALLGQADLVISGAGSTCWQICCSGVPLIAVQSVKNQREVVRSLAERHCALTLTAEAFLQAIADGSFARLIERFRSVTVRQEMVKVQRQLVDGDGAARIIDVMESEYA